MPEALRPILVIYMAETNFFRTSKNGQIQWDVARGGSKKNYCNDHKPHADNEQLSHNTKGKIVRYHFRKLVQPHHTYKKVRAVRLGLS